MAKTPRALAADLAIVVCQLGELTKLYRKLPPASSLSLRLRGTGEEPVVNCYIHDGPADADATCEHLRQIGALRAWAHALGSELHLTEPRPYVPGRVSRRLSTEGTLPNGLRVEAYTLLEYDPDALEYHGQRAAVPAIAAA